MKHTWIISALAVLVQLMSLQSCCDTEKPVDPEQVVILYADGFNSLSSYIYENIDSLKTGYVPGMNSRSILLMVTKMNENSSYSVQAPPRIIRLYSSNGQIVEDTLLTMDTGAALTEPSVMTSALSYIKGLYPVDHYGLVVSSHGTGWLPDGFYSDYYNDPSKYEDTGIFSSGIASVREKGGKDVFEMNLEPGRIPVKSICQEYRYDGSIRSSLEMDIRDFAGAIPMHLDYIVFDACFMGGAEVAYELRNVCDNIIFSPTEFLAYGLIYNTLGKRLMGGQTPDLKGVCTDYMNYYKRLSGEMKSATITLVDCSGLENLAKTCKDLFSRYRDALDTLPYEGIQIFYRLDEHWFYDLKDIMAKAGASSEDLATLQAALDGCVTNKDNTEAFLEGMGGFRIHSCCGLSMYLPSHGVEYLDTYYRDLGWNKATGLVR